MKSSYSGWVYLAFIIVAFSLFIAAVVWQVYTNEHFIHECADALGLEDYSTWNNNSLTRDVIDSEHINCCLKQVYMIDEGYYTNSHCIGFLMKDGKIINGDKQ